MTRLSAAVFGVFTAAQCCYAQLTPATDITGEGDKALDVAITEVIQKILGYVAIIAVIVIIIAGLRMVISSGDDQAVEKAKKTLLWAVAGLIVIIISAGIVNIVLGNAGADVEPTALLYYLTLIA